MTKTNEMKNLTTKFTILLGILIAGFFIFSSTGDVYHSAYASSSSSPGGKTNSPGDGAACIQCHTGVLNPSSPPTAAASISSPGLASGFYVPGQTYTINATFTGVNSNKIGFEITAEEDLTTNKSGTIIITDASRTQLVNGNNAVTHNGSAGTAAASNSNAWTFDWTAPAAGAGSITFYGAFNATNSNFGTSGDAVFTSTLTVQEGLSTSIEEKTENLVSVYPNPVINNLQIRSENDNLKSITIRNLEGKLVTSLEQNGRLISIDMSGTPSGVYLVEVQSDEETSIQKIIKK